MDRLLARLERRIGRFAVPNLIGYVVGGMAIFGVLSFVHPEVVRRMVLDIDAIRRGQVWRLLTFLLIPPQLSRDTWGPISFLVALYFTWWIGSSLEQRWGAFKFNVYYFVGAIWTVLAACVAGPTSNVWLNASLFLAFATTFPDETILLMFILPIRVKWLGLAGAAYLAWSFATEGEARVAIAAALVNYFLFFGGHWVAALRGRSLAVRQKARRESMAASAATRAPSPVFGQRVCAVCGAREADGADIRVCSCDKCGGKPRALCLEHARSH